NALPAADCVSIRSGCGCAVRTQTAKLPASTGAISLHYAPPTAISGNTIVAGAPGATVAGNASQGTAYVFVKPASGWADGTQTAKLTASGGLPEDLLGSSVAIDGDTIVAGAPSPPVTPNPHHGAVYVFVKPRSRVSAA